MPRLSVCIFFLLFMMLNPVVCRALDVYQLTDSRAYSMGNTTTVLPGFGNPAGYGFEPSRHLSLHYANRYGVKELSLFSGVVNYSNPYLDVGLSVSRFGFDAYNETLLSANFYKKLASYLSVGIRVNYLNLHYSMREESKSLFTADIGALLKPIERLTLSVVAVNPANTKLRVGEEQTEIPVVLLVGAAYQVSSDFLLTGEVEKDFIYPAIYKVGMEYVPTKELSIRAGLFGKPFTPSFGVGLHLYSFTLDLAFSHHPVLGFRSCCGLQFNF